MKFLANLFGSQSADAKTLEQSRAQLAAAKASAEQVAALFTNAALDLDGMLAAGPDALKAHLATISAKDGELAAALAKVKDLEAKVTTATADLNSANTTISAVSAALAPIGITATTKPEEYAGVIASHVKKESALELAKGGHKPVDDVQDKTAAKGGPAMDQTLTGVARTQAHFKSKAPAKSGSK